MEKSLFLLAIAIVAVTGLTGCNPSVAVQGESHADSGQSVGPTPAVDTREREAYITGKPPRIAPLPPDQINKNDIVDLREAISAPPMADKAISNYVATMLRHPALYKRHTQLAIQLYKGALKPHDRELVVLRVGWLCQAPWEWGEHTKLGKRLGSLTDEEIARVTVGSAAPEWSDHDRALLKAVEELHADAMISDETWIVLAQSLNEQQLLELPILVGQYQGVAYLENSTRLRPLAGNPGLSAR